MKKICHNFCVAGALMLSLSACSIVVFEDGPSCPAQKECPVMRPLTPEVAPVPDATPAPAANAETPAAMIPESSLPAQQVETAAPVIDGHISYFAYDSADLGPVAQQELLELAAYLADKTDIELIIEGHCDERGSRDYNLALGDRRAVAVRDFLAANGVSAGRIKTVSFGKERPVAVGTGPEIWARNRRAIIRQVGP